MQFKIPKLILYAGCIGLAIICLFAIIDNYELAVNQGLSTTISCYESTAHDQSTGLTKPVKVCDSYNPQLVFYGSIVLLIFDGLIFYWFNKAFSHGENDTRKFVKNLNKNKSYLT